MILATAVAAIPAFGLAQDIQVPFPKTPAETTQPANGVLMPDGYVKAVAQMAYIWGWPMVNQFNRRTNITKAPYPARNGGTIPVAPRGQLAMLTDYIKPLQSFVTCPNQDVVYGLGYFALDEEPVVIQVPDFGDRFWVYAFYDARTGQFANIGKPYGTKPGFYLISGPKWNGAVPSGITAVVRSSTELANVIPRVFQDDTAEDKRAVQSVVNQIVAYPLTKFDGKMKTVDYSKIPSIGEETSGGGETQWVVPGKYFDQLGWVLDNVDPLPGEEALYSQFRQLLAVGSKNPHVRKVMDDAAVDTDKSVFSNFSQWKYNGAPAGNNWTRSTNNARFGVDYFDRAGTAKSNMFDNKPNETQYFYTDNDSKGAQLTGAGLYSITFAKGQVPPVNGFWSLTLYNQHHMFSANELSRFSVGTKSKSLKYNPDGSLTIYAGKHSPGKDKESNWLPAPDGNFSLYIRAYWGEQGILDGSWQPPAVEKRK